MEEYLTNASTRSQLVRTMNPLDSAHIARLQQLTHRHFLRGTGVGLGAVGLALLLQKDGIAAPASNDNPLAPKQAHFEGRAKRVIYLHLTGSPPHLDLF